MIQKTTFNSIIFLLLLSSVPTGSYAWNSEKQFSGTIDIDSAGVYRLAKSRLLSFGLKATVIIEISCSDTVTVPAGMRITANAYSDQSRERHIRAQKFPVIDTLTFWNDPLGGRQFRKLALWIDVDKAPVGKLRHLTYKITARSAIFTPAILVYFSISLLLSIVLTFLMLNRKAFSRIADISWKESWKSAIRVLSQALILVLIIDEIGLLLNEWGIPAGFFGLFRHWLELPGISQVTYLANLGIIIPATYGITIELLRQMKKENEAVCGGWPAFETFVRRIAMIFSFVTAAISVMFFLVQCTVWNEYGLEYSEGFPVELPAGWMVLLTVFMPAVPMVMGTKRIDLLGKEMNPYRHELWYTRFSTFLVCIVCFLCFAQTMITKVILLLSLADWARPRIVGMITGLIKKVSILKQAGTNWTFEGQTRMIFGRKGRWNLLSFFYLTLSFLPLLLLWQVHGSPYPPTDSAFPKTETISFFYCLYMITFLLIRFSPQTGWLLPCAWMIFATFVLYGMPLVAPSWFFPSLDPPGESFLELFKTMGGSSLYACAIFFSIHIMAVIIFAAWWYRCTLLELLRKNSFSDRKFTSRYLGITSLPLPFFTIMMGFILVFSIGSYDVIKLLLGYFLKESLPVLMISAAVFSLAVTVCAYILTGSSICSYCHEEISKAGGKELVARIAGEHVLPRLFRKWCGKSNLALTVPVLMLLWIALFTAYFIASLIPAVWASLKKDSDMVWVAPLDMESRSADIYASGASLIVQTKSDAHAFSADSGVRLWRVQGKVCALDDSVCVIAFSDSANNSLNGVKALDVINGNTVWKHVITVDSPALGTARIIRTGSNELVVAYGHTLEFLGFHSGEPFDRITDFSSLLLKKCKGRFCYTDTLNRLQLRRAKEKWDVIDSIADTVSVIFSLTEGILVQSSEGLMFYNTSGIKKWNAMYLAGENIFDVTIVNGVCVVASRECMYGLSVETGVFLWKKGLNEFVLNTGLENDYIRQAGTGIVAWEASDKKLVLIDSRTGEPKVRYKEIRNVDYMTPLCIANDTLYAMGRYDFFSFLINQAQPMRMVSYNSGAIKIMRRHNEWIRLSDMKSSILSACAVSSGKFYWTNEFGLFAMEL